MSDKSSSLFPLAEQPLDVPWPSLDRTAPNGGWPTSGYLPPAANALMDEAFESEGPLRKTYGVVLVQGGKLLAERYEGNLPTLEDPNGGEECTATTKFLSWSMAKSMLHSIVGILVEDGKLSLDQSSLLPEWQSKTDRRKEISVHDLLAMRDGLTFQEDYSDQGKSHVIDMLYGKGSSDTAHYAALRPLVATPGTRFNYSSGTTNLLSKVVSGVVGNGETYRQFLCDRLFTEIGMYSATPGFDDAGTWVASTYVHATARDFARFGMLYARGGKWDDKQILSGDWVDSARTQVSKDPADGRGYSLQWWVVPDNYGTFACRGYAGQWISISPALDLIVVRLGDTPSDRFEGLFDWYMRMIDSFGKNQGPS